MVFIKFTSPNYPGGGGLHYWVGTSEAAIMADTADGTQFSWARFSSRREITEDEARSLGLGYLEEGIASVKKAAKAGKELAFKLKTPQKEDEEPA